MRLVCRAFAMTVSLALVAGWGGSAFAGPAPPVPPMDETQIRRWSDWWMNEIEQQCLPTPQLLFFQSNPYHPYRSPGPDLRMSEIWTTEELEILDPLRFPTHQEWNQANTEHLNAEIFMMPSGPVPIGAWNKPRLRLGSCFGGDQPKFKLRPPAGIDGPFTWAKNIRAPATVRFAVFSAAQFEDGASLKWNIQKRLSECGDLGLFEYGYRINLVRNHPFFSSHCE